MLAYRHQFHAGGFTDVFKHALLAQLVIALRNKVKPFFYLDTHAGPAATISASVGAEEQGIPRRHRAGLDAHRCAAALAPYLDAVRAENPDGKLRRYPGSPLIARALLRSHDRMALTELNKTDCAALEALFARDRQVEVRLADGYEALKAFLPPRERRGIVFVDSSFDRAQEFDRLTRGSEAHRRFATGIHALWYPLMEPPAMQAFERSIVATRIRRILQLELSVRDAGRADNCEAAACWS